MANTLEELQAENEKLKAAVIQAENDKLRAQLDAVRSATTAPTEEVRGMTIPRDRKIIEIVHQDDPKTGEHIAKTIRTDFGYDPHQKFVGRQP
jgi:hypothetical protein